jgi:hypothetical protein
MARNLRHARLQNGDTRLLFDVEIQALVSSRCSPETSCYSSSSNSITSKLYLIPRCRCGMWSRH